MRPRNRLLSFGAAFALIVLGAFVGALVPGIAGEAIATALAALGGIAVVSLLFLEIGFSEDHERERELKRHDALPPDQSERRLQRLTRRRPRD